MCSQKFHPLELHVLVFPGCFLVMVCVVALYLWSHTQPGCQESSLLSLGFDIRLWLVYLFINSFRIFYSNFIFILISLSIWLTTPSADATAKGPGPCVCEAGQGEGMVHVIPPTAPAHTGALIPWGRWCSSILIWRQKPSRAALAGP